jgi:hypothetical protein
VAQPRNGITLISPDDWDSYQLPALAVLRPRLVKFQMYYGDGIASPVFDGGHVDQVVALGAAVIIFRTSEHRISDHDVDQQLGPLAPLIERYRQQGSPVEFWLEVGNEPDLTGLDPWVTRWHLLNTRRALAPRSQAELPTLRWMASLPTKAGGEAYLQTILGDAGDGLGTLASGPNRYDALGVHAYGFDSLDPGDGNDPWFTLTHALATPLPLFVTEAGINAPLPWEEKARRYAAFLALAPPRVQGVMWFTLSRDPQWVSATHYGIDVDPSGAVDPRYAGCAVLAAA